MYFLIEQYATTNLKFDQNPFGKIIAQDEDFYTLVDSAQKNFIDEDNQLQCKISLEALGSYVTFSSSFSIVDIQDLTTQFPELYAKIQQTA